MPSDYYFGYYFYAPNGRFEPCGMFTLPHIVSASLCLFIVALCIFFTKNRFNPLARIKFFRFSAVLLTILEVIKICHSFLYSELHLDAWFPLSYCGLFIFALWMIGFGNDKLKLAGETFIAYGCPVAGIAFLIFPTTSLMSFPVWHYFSLYSLLFHSLMIFCGVILLMQQKRLNKQIYLSYIFFVLGFSIIAITMNTLYGCNLMNLREPYNIPIEFLQDLYKGFKWGYTALVIFIYAIIPFFVAFINKISRKKVSVCDPQSC